MSMFVEEKFAIFCLHLFVLPIIEWTTRCSCSAWSPLSSSPFSSPFSAVCCATAAGSTVAGIRTCTRPLMIPASIPFAVSENEECPSAFTNTAARRASLFILFKFKLRFPISVFQIIPIFEKMKVAQKCFYCICFCEKIYFEPIA